jgi:orotidine-5'-phosphate decarboxylase
MGEQGPTDSFSVRVAKAVAGTGPMCAGIDPSVQLLGQWGLATDAGGLHTFGMRCVEAFAGVVPVVKPQVAFFERCGSAGIAALESVMAAAREAGIIVIADAKRGDVDTTVEAYASAWLDPDGPFAADAVTAVAYLGLGALRPLFDLAARHGNGVIVVARSSNPEGRRLQQALCDAGAGPPVEDLLLAEIAALNHGGLAVRGAVGAVVGATLAPSGYPLGELGGTILAPGVGAQGGGAEQVAALFSACPPGSVLASASRSVLAAGPDVKGLAAAARRCRDEMAAALA